LIIYKFILKKIKNTGARKKKQIRKKKEDLSRNKIFTKNTLKPPESDGHHGAEFVPPSASCSGPRLSGPSGSHQNGGYKSGACGEG
jgi:hypothetical protein